MATSQNGWPVIDRDDLGPVVVRGVAMVPGVRRSVVPLFLDLCHGLAAIEAPHDGWCWGWASRPIRGQDSGYSNHASGTAIDWNAPHHGRGGPRHAGFSSAQVASIQRLLRRYDGVVRWGGDYQAPPFDPMHFEIDGTPDQVRRVIERLTAPAKEAGFMGVEFKNREELEAFIQDAVYGPGKNTPRVEGTVNAGQVVETAATAARAAKASADKAVAAVAELRKLVEGLVLRGGDENPTGRLP